MNRINFKIVQPNDKVSFELIANWYLSEWKIPAHKTIQRLQHITASSSQFQILMTLDGTPVSTGGLYNHVTLLEKEPRLKIYQNWLALLYTIPEKRKLGLGALICQQIQEQAREAGIASMYLFTDSAENLYKRLGWIALEKLNIDKRTVVVMRKDLFNTIGQ